MKNVSNISKNKEHKKFIEEILTNEWEIETPSGWQSFDGVAKTVEYQEWILETSSGKSIICADEHIVIDSENCQRFVSDIKIGEYILTRDGLEEVTSVIATENYSHMYDLLNVNNGSVFYSNAIVSHNSTTATGYLLHQLIFNDNFTIGILANKLSMSKEIIARIQLAYEKLPKWIQHGIVSWNKGSIELENGSSIVASSTSSSAVRGYSFNTIFLDEFAFVPEHIANDFFTSTYPTISAGKSTKIIITSTPYGFNLFYKLWDEAIHGKNQFVPLEIKWNDVPGRDEKFREDTIENIGIERWRQEFSAEFLGSADTLISSEKLSSIPTNRPLEESEGMAMFEEVNENSNYLITVDVSRGLGQDYSAFLVFDITSIPYKVVYRYKNNKIKPMMLPSIIKKVAEQYNNSHVLIEINDIGQQVAEILYMELEYEYVLMCKMRGRAGQVLGGYFSSKAQYGIKMSASTKKLGCSNLKTLIESDRLIFTDYEILNELTRFVRHNNTYRAEVGCNDDLSMCLIIFAWASTQPHFKDIASNDVRLHLYKEKQKLIDNQLMPFGFKENGVEYIRDDKGKDRKIAFVDNDAVWFFEEEDPEYNLGHNYLL